MRTACGLRMRRGKPQAVRGSAWRGGASKGSTRPCGVKRRASKVSAPSLACTSYNTAVLPSFIGLRDQSHSVKGVSIGSSPSFESKYAWPLQRWAGCCNATSTRACGANGPQRCRPCASKGVLKSNSCCGCTVMRPRTRCGMGTPTSSMSMCKAAPSQCSWLGPMTKRSALRALWRWPRSVMVQRLAPRLYKATFRAQWLSGSGCPPLRRAHA